MKHAWKGRGWKVRPGLVPALLLVVLGAAPVRSDSLTELLAPLPESAEPLLFALRLDQSNLSDELTVLQRGHSYFVPLGELCRLLDLAVAVDPGRGLAAGFLIDEAKLFELDARLHTVKLAGQRRSFDPAAVLQEADDLYVDAALVGDWLPLSLEVRPNDLLIRVLPREPLPLQLRLAREKKLAAARQRDPAADLPRLALPYRLFDGPFLDASLRASHRRSAGEGSDTLLEYSLTATGELLFLESYLFLAGTTDGLRDARLSLGRKDPEGRLLGPLHARELTLGEVFHPGLELVALPRSGTGFLVSNFPLEQPSQLGRENFRGELPPGWEAELYRGEELLAYARSRPDGLYEFLDVPLLFGLNLFRVELYGPQGQRRTDTRLLNVDDSLTPPGEVHYRLAGVDPAARLAGPAPAGASRRTALEVSTGLGPRLSAQGAVSVIDFGGRRETYGQGGLRFFRGPLLGSFDLAFSGDGGSAAQARLQSRWRSFGLELAHAQIDGLRSEALKSPAGQLTGRSRLRLDGVAPALGFLPRLPFSFDLRYDRLESGRRISEVGARIAGFRRGLAVSNQLSFSTSRGGGEPALPAAASGQLLVSKFLPALSFRGQADYRLRPRAELASLALTAEKSLRGGVLVAAGIDRAMQTGRNRYQASVSRLDGPVGYTATADYADGQGYGVSLLLSLSFSRAAEADSWHTQARPLAMAGGLAGRIFLDENGNGIFDPGEEPVANAGLLVGGAGDPQRSGADGRLLLVNLPPHRQLALALAASTLEDPYWQPAQPGVAILPRPGKLAAIDFPVQIAGELSGTIYLLRAGKRREAGGVELELVNARGEVVARTRSAADGFYDLDRLRPGTYTLRVQPEQAARLQVVAAPTREVRLEAGGSVLDDLNFLLTVGES